MSTIPPETSGDDCAVKMAASVVITAGLYTATVIALAMAAIWALTKFGGIQ